RRRRRHARPRDDHGQGSAALAIAPEAPETHRGRDGPRLALVLTSQIRSGGAGQRYQRPPRSRPPRSRPPRPPRPPPPPPNPPPPTPPRSPRSPPNPRPPPPPPQPPPPPPPPGPERRGRSSARFTRSGRPSSCCPFISEIAF